MGKVIGAWHWTVLYVTGKRCFVCGAFYATHGPFRMRRCNRTPLRIEFIGREDEQAA